MMLKDIITSCYGDVETVICKRVNFSEDLEYYERSERVTYWKNLFERYEVVKLYHTNNYYYINSNLEVEYFIFISDRFIIYLK